MVSVSIIVPCFNAEKYVADAIRSALDQTYPNKDVIVVDDGSTDGSLAVIRSFGDRIRWETIPHRGGSAARNRGIEVARGELVQFLDADDILHSRKLERQVKAHLKSGARITFCDWETIWDNGRRRAVNSPRPDDDPVIFVLNNQLQTAAPLHRRETLLQVGGFREDLVCSQERDLHVRLACAGTSFYRVPEVLFTQRRLPGSVSEDIARIFDQHPKILWPAYERLKESGHLTDARARAFAGVRAQGARFYLRAGRPQKARECFQEARRMHPSGGLETLHPNPWTRLLSRILGPMYVERLILFRHGLKGTAR